MVLRPLNELAVLAFTLFTLMMVSVQAQAQTFDAGDLKYQVVSGTNTVKVKGLASGFTGTGIEIPSTVSHSDNGTTTTYTVATIDRDAFANNTSLISVDIGDSVTTIGQGAFQGNTSLISVDIGDSVTTIDAKAFRNNTNLKSLTIGNSVTTINDVAFESTDLTSVTIPDSDIINGCRFREYRPHQRDHSR